VFFDRHAEGFAPAGRGPADRRSLSSRCRVPPIQFQSVSEGWLPTAGDTMNRKIARIGPSGAAFTAVVGSVLLSLLILAPSPEGLLPGTAPAGAGRVDALLLPKPHVARPPAHRLRSVSAPAPAPTAPASTAAAASRAHTSPSVHRSASSVATKPATKPAPRTPAAPTPTPTPTPTPIATPTPAATTHVPASGHHGKPPWAAHPHGQGAAPATTTVAAPAAAASPPAAAHPTHPVHPTHPLHPAHPAIPATGKGGKAKSAHG
jgi:hypothetical protein